MLDPQLLRKDLDAVAARLADRGFTLDTAWFRDQEAQRKAAQTRAEELQSRRNALSRQIGAMKGRGEDTTALMAEVAGIAQGLAQAQQANEAVQARLAEWLQTLPNLPQPGVPVGRDENGNREVRRWGEPRVFAAQPRDHVEIGAPFGLDFETAGKLSGSRFALMRAPDARLHRALPQFRALIPI